ncbi:MAG: 3'-5' exoribonuclease [Nostoc sp. NMS7]|uniref:3'-5' exoribonuclease n=1 Tax=Nostoc sp. NMS7 TaxID=2815391 RepID=UPI0025E6DED2|nr:3'-5' exoribonuclease [Nostoc sp. NMS7]MBN3946431.1 3'-5' exoribonuclease [Nostoc sp. NMS7]
MRYFIDLEFIENAKTIDLISIGIVAQDGREFYAVNEECNFSKANYWVQENVIPSLPVKNDPAWKTRDMIAFEVVAFIKQEPESELYHHTFGSLCNLPMDEKPEFWGEWCAYD